MDGFRSVVKERPDIIDRPPEIVDGYRLRNVEGVLRLCDVDGNIVGGQSAVTFESLGDGSTVVHVRFDGLAFPASDAE